MGMAYPLYHLTEQELATILGFIDEVIKKYFANASEPITKRPLRPKEINTSLTSDTSTYKMTMQASSAWGKLCADTAAASITVPVGSVYVIFGWLCVDTAPMQTQATAADWKTIGLEAVGQIKVNGVMKSEVALKEVDVSPNHMLLQLDSIIVAPENAELLIQAKGKDDGEAIVFPLGYRIGPESQLNVS